MFNISQVLSASRAQLSKLWEYKPQFIERISAYVQSIWEEIGIIYELTNSNGVKSYLIGTSIVDQESIQKGSFLRIVSKCSRLFSESGAQLLRISPHKDLETNSQYQHLPFRYDLDFAITLEAQHKKIPVVALDPGIDPEYDKRVNVFQETGSVAYRKMTIARLEETNKDPFTVFVIQKWKEQDVEYLAEKRFKCAFGQIAKWEDAWMKVLLPALTETQKPICIAVGWNHVVGYKGLAERFQKSGFKVELLRGHPSLIQRMAKRMFDCLSLKSDFPQVWL